jgi:hypothetical protein
MHARQYEPNGDKANGQFKVKTRGKGDYDKNCNK